MPGKMIRGQTAEMGGPKQANLLPNPTVAAKLIKNAKHPLLVIGSESTERQTNDGDIIDSAMRVAKNTKIGVVATGHLLGAFRKRGVEVSSMPLVVLGKYLIDPEWMGFDGEGRYDTVVFIGYPYYMEWLVESGLKSFSNIRTISLDRTYHPNAQWSLGWMPKPEWREALDTIISSLEEDA